MGKKPEKWMPPEEKRRLFELRCRSKRGDHISRDDMRFLERCWKLYPEQYAAMNDEVFDRTLPFGAEALRRKTNG